MMLTNPDQTTNPGTLYLIATPIGNLEDITFRALRMLREVDRVAAEDTRRTRLLLDHYGISRPLISYHDHNKEQRSIRLLEDLEKGETVALVSDAGTPGISDPAYYLVRLAIQHDVPVVPIPGPASPIAALVISGLPPDRFVFEGFLPAKAGKRRSRLRNLIDEARTIVLLESPHRLVKTLQDIQDIMGDRQAAVVRELTKKFEEVSRGSVSQLLESYAEKKPKGEMVIVLAGRPA
jgi:16S rRNA (cytidine1402-2'-O)-methyltransferase